MNDNDDDDDDDACFHLSMDSSCAWKEASALGRHRGWEEIGRENQRVGDDGSTGASIHLIKQLTATTFPPTRTRNTEHDTFSLGQTTQHGATAFIFFIFLFGKLQLLFSGSRHNGKGLYFFFFFFSFYSLASLGFDFGCFVFSFFLHTRAHISLTSGAPSPLS
ncbi:uncharacterized protein LY79DRAFT_153795 [Colletotrichum navitas]|uniref:Uncharacterized protein n=1 Tax=Colletotrichum navitas TaxID=681940 RepID=A0AAD8Q1V0_9PEZI|nr:uncharacterized protein LY79DRAFT_153795 [Colletotrichum navitas]KAK1594330.1 hypothetical protein LY79DRAFT_153795 [Colletotrichum navitas]